MKNFKRIKFGGIKAELASATFLLLLATGLLLMAQNFYAIIGLNEHKEITYLDPSALSFIKGNSLLFYFGGFFVFTSIAMVLVISLQGYIILSFIIAISATGLSITTDDILSYIGISIPIIYLALFFTIIISLFFLKFKTEKQNFTLPKLLISSISLQIIHFMLLFSFFGSIVNHLQYQNHYRYSGNHTLFSSVSDICANAGYTLWFEHSIIPTMIPCYFEQYNSEETPLTRSEESFLQVTYGAMIDYQNFIYTSVPNIVNYDSKTAVYIFQVAHESLRERVTLEEKRRSEFSTKTNSKYIEFVGVLNKIIENNHKYYVKSYEQNPEDFISYVKNIDENEKSMLIRTLIGSLNIEPKAKQTLTLSRMIELRNNVINKKTNNDNEIKNKEYLTNINDIMKEIKKFI